MTHEHHRSRRARLGWWLTAIAALAWLLVRSGPAPRRLAYPCQRAALATAGGVLAHLAGLLGLAQVGRLALRRTGVGSVAGVTLLLVLTLALGGSGSPAPPAGATVLSPILPAWTSATAVSDVFVATEVPVPQCSLDGGTLPSTPPCNAPAVAFADPGVDALIAEMETRGTFFYRTTAHPGGLVSTDGVVVIKINNQWAAYGDGTGLGRLTTNTDALKGLIWAVLQHPDGFTGEVVVAENTQYVAADWNITPANAEDQNQSFQDVVAAFQGQGHNVTTSTWDYLNDTLLAGSTVGGGLPPGEYANGNSTDGYILLEDPAAGGSNELSYPKFRTAGGHDLSLLYGVWGGATYDPDRLTLINMPVLKVHGMAGATIAWKNLIGFVTIADEGGRFGDWDEMHDFFWGYTGNSAPSYGLIGRQLARVRAPDLHLVDAIWVANQDNTSGGAIRCDVLLASSDPFAVDWYASEYLLRPLADLGGWVSGADASAARGGTFRSATRVNQDAAAAVWPGTYPYMDLTAQNPSSPLTAEHDQLNVYLATGGGIFSDGFEGATTDQWSGSYP